MWDAHSVASSSEAEQLRRRIQGTSPTWQVVLATSGVAVLVADTSQAMRAHLLHDGAGVMLGEIFLRSRDLDSDAAAPDARFGPLETKAALDSEGRILASGYWGNFVGVLVDDRRLGG